MYLKKIRVFLFKFCETSKCEIKPRDAYLFSFFRLFYVELTFRSAFLDVEIYFHADFVVRFELVDLTRRVHCC